MKFSRDQQLGRYLPRYVYIKYDLLSKLAGSSFLIVALADYASV